MKKKKKQPTKAERIAKAEQELQETLKLTGYDDFKVKHKKSRRPDFPDLKVVQKYKSLGNGFGKATPKKELPKDAKQFPVGNSHKQGLELIYSQEYVKWMNGKKT